MTDSKAIGKKFASIRKQLRINQSDAAKQLDVTQSCLSQLENGQRKWSCEMALKAIKLYRVSYESVFGELEKQDVPIFEDEENSPAVMLQMLADASGSREVSFSARAYTYIGAYVMFRRLYESNPKNSSAIFSIDREQAEKIAKELMLNEPERISAYIKFSKRINSGTFELPVEYSTAVREAVERCEEIIRIMLEAD